MTTLTPEMMTATVLHREGRLQAAEALYRQLTSHVSQAAQAHAALGLLLSQQGRFQEARQHYEQVAARSPGDFLAHKLLADACSEAGDVAASVEHYRNAARCRPDEWLWQLRADIVTPLVFSSNSAIDESRARLIDGLQYYAGAPGLSTIDEVVASGCKPPIALAYQGRNDRPIKELFASLFASRIPADLPRVGTGKPHVGFVVTEGNEGVFLRGMAGVLRHLDRSRLRVTLIGAKSAETAHRTAIGSEIEYIVLGKCFSQTVNEVRAARIDLIYFWEIGTDCTNYFLPFLRLAPIQCSSWGWPVTSGIAEVDYFLSSELLEPDNAESHYTEKLVRFAQVPNYYSFPDVPTESLDVRASLSNYRRIYLCAQNPRKLHPDFDLLAGRILRCDGEGILLLVESSKHALTQALKHRFERTLPDCVDRIRWLPRMTQREYWAWLQAADCVLDTPHYCGGANSTYDAFAVGAPIVTLTGAYHRGRYTTAAYQAMGMTELAASSPDAYVNLALQLAGERDFREACRRQICERRAVHFDNIKAVKNLQEWFLKVIAVTR